ncbi:hypothetical protein BH10ACT3_BH10ACT3_05950 [soil metagenome]
MLAFPTIDIYPLAIELPDLAELMKFDFDAGLDGEQIGLPLAASQPTRPATANGATGEF